MPRNRGPLRRLLALLLAWMLLAAPFASLAAGPMHKSVGAADVVVAHAEHGGHMNHAQVADKEAPSNKCEKHESCNGSCCASCAQCSVTVPAISADASIYHPPYALSGASTFRSYLSFFLSRPPQAA